MAIHSNSLTIAFDLDVNLQSMLHNFGNLVHSTESRAVNIPGLHTCRFSSMSSTLDLQKIRRGYFRRNMWVNCDRFDVLNQACLHRASSVAFGALADTSIYNYHKKIMGIQVDFNVKRKEIFLIKEQFRLRLAVDCLGGYFVIDPQQKIFLPMKKPVRCFEEIGERYPRRTFNFTHKVTSADLADTSVICLADSSNASQLMSFLINELNLQCFHSLLPIQISCGAFNREYRLHSSNNFLSCYAWEMILSLGFYIKDRLTVPVMNQINQLAKESEQESYPEHRFYRKMIAIYHIAKKNQFFNIQIQLSRIRPQWVPETQSAYDYIPRIFLTPYGQYPRPLKPLRANRVTRQIEKFGPLMEHFCRVILRDCNMESIHKDLIESWRYQLRNILINVGLVIGQRQFQFLLFSNSQLRDASLCFYHQYNGNTVEDIHQWMGEFNHERSIGTRIARMAQCFTSTMHGLKLRSDQLICIPDLHDQKNRCFTDGCGKISSSLLRKLFVVIGQQDSSINLKQLPSVIQIRCGGLKGILVEAPDLAGDAIHYRKSQEKFQSNHLVIELINYSKPKMVSLNRQVIVLLEHMGVHQSVFIEFQNACRKRLSMALISKRGSVSLLKSTTRYYDWERINQSGVLIPQEPFYRSLLLTLYRDRSRRLCDKTHIPLPMSDARMLYGVVDETASLTYGEVFIRISDESLDKEETKYRVICGTDVIVTRMPCHHPGDIRVLHAVDKPRLHHLVDCIVFPVKGPRPHSTEMAGGDYDGDEYWTCWNVKLIGQIQRVHKPAEYLSPEKPKVEGEHTIEMRVDFILNILTNGPTIGILSRRHLALCARYSPEHPTALRMTQFINDSLDFPKTGISSITSEILQQLNVHEYPDFMQNKTKTTFPCNKSLGILFQEMEHLNACHSSSSKVVQTPTIDPDFLISGYEKYIEQGKVEYEEYCDRMHAIMNTYDLNDETELITGCHFGIPEEAQNNDDTETANQEFRVLRVETKKRFQTNIDRRSSVDRQRKAAAWYFVAYSSVSIGNYSSNQHRCLSFPWTVYEVLCEIKNSRSIQILASVPSPHQSLDRIGKALIQNRGRVQADTQYFVAQFATQWIKSTFQHSRTRSLWLKELSTYCKTNENFWSMQDSGTSHTNRIAEQFLILIDFLSRADSSVHDFQRVAHELLLFLHQIASTNDIIHNQVTLSDSHV